ncbi:hypothetical protein JDV02_003964 [Purpureocillium takamizusanense]|uniref:Uncharacterized protein n=1 Tax=Purpureocillium takamizusanense TaxID=2060973 RepID=A0A9Q8QEB0_9HYPO|nr:uncharacterized protein JDV02_003964 [Purpureocillium takamizusanense]UNI17636.1 hypothetical protein JDV02_003964 [Purpureocillium takamizusanense]
MPKSPSNGLRAFRRFTGAKSDAPPVPPLPPIPESLKPGVSKGLAKLLERRKLRMEQIDSEASAGTPMPSAKKNATLSASFGRSGGRPALTTKYSNPELRVPKSRASHNTSSSGSSGRLTPTSSRSPSYPASQNVHEQIETYDRVDKFPASFALAAPRISPMEYTRTYLLEKAAAEREGRECQLPAPEQNWHWTPNWESFLIVPSIPKNINREAAAQPQVADPEEQDGSDAESATTVKMDNNNNKPSSAPCPRLSLNLGGMTALFPSVMNLARLGMDDGQDGPLPGRSEASPQRPMRKSRSSSLLQHSVLTRITEETSDDDEPERSLLRMRSRSTESLARPEPQVGSHGYLVGASTGLTSEPEQDLGSYGQAVPYDHAGTMAWLNRAEVSSVYSAESADTAVRVGSAGPSTPKAAQAHTPTSSSPTVASDVRRHNATPLSPSHSAVLLSPASARPVVEYSPASLAPSWHGVASPASSSPRNVNKGKALAGAGDGTDPTQHDPRLLLDRANSEQSVPRQKKSEQPKSVLDDSIDRSDRATATSEANLHPAPLKVRKQRSPPGKEWDAERCSIMWQGLSDEIGQRLAEFRKFADSDTARDSRAQSASQNPPGATTTPTKQQRAASAVVSPSSSEFTLDSAWIPSLTIPRSESHSGFTPSRPKSDNNKRHSVLPDSPTLPAQDVCGHGYGTPPASLAMRRRQEKRQQLMSPRQQPQPEHGAPRETNRSVSSPAPGAKTARDSGPHSGPPATAKTLSSKDSSFALNESKVAGSVTMLPRLRSSTPGSSKSSGSQIPVPVSPATQFAQSPVHLIKRRPAALTAMTPLAFQRFDTAARLATVAEKSTGRRTSSSSAEKETRTLRGPSSLSNLLRKYSRSRVNDNEADGSYAALQGQSGRGAGLRAASGVLRADEQPRRLRKTSSEGRALKEKKEQINEPQDGLMTSSERLMGLQSFIDRQSPSRLPSPSPAAAMSSADNELKHPAESQASRAKQSLGRHVDSRPSRKLQKPSKENLRLARVSSGRL